jgi:hypothetical protein
MGGHDAQTAGPPGGPGADPDEAGYEGRVTVGEEGTAEPPTPVPTEEFAVTEEQVDDGSEGSFPASDPPSWSSPVDRV